jgi:tRNA nucleotidyltransferase/poly(A) polymerase
MAFALREQQFYDPHAGREALAAGQIISVSPENMQDDPLRIVRAARFMLEIEGVLSSATRDEMRSAVSGLDGVARERFTVELNHIFASNNSGRGIRELAAVGALQNIFPPLAALAGLEQNNFHHLDALEHTLAVIDSLDTLCQKNPLSLPQPAAADCVLLKWTALFHDVGKALSKTVDPDTGTIHFLGHERFSSHLTRETLAGFALGKDFLRRLERLIENHLRPLLLNLENCKEKALRRLVFDLEEDLYLLLLHTYADLEATRGREPQPRQQNLIKLSRRLKAIFELERETFIKPFLSGKDLIALGLEPGPAIGTIIRMIHQKQLAGEISDKDEALAAAKLLL